MEGAWIEANSPENDQFIFQCEDFASSTRAEAIAILAALITAPYKCHVTINTDSITCMQQMDNILHKDNPIWRKMANQTVWSFIKWIICTKNLTIFMVKVKAHSGDLLNNLTDKLAKGSYKINVPILNISDNFKYQLTMTKWADILIDKPHSEFFKQLFQAQYFNRFLLLRRNEPLWSLTINGKIDWKMSIYFYNFNVDAPQILIPLG